jgi:hypothetical protein
MFPAEGLKLSLGVCQKINSDKVHCEDETHV